MRLKPNVVIQENVRNQSSRDGATIKLIVLHDTESPQAPKSASDLAGVTNWFDTPGADASAHVITDGDGNSARCVPDAQKAWHCAAYNSISLGIEQIGYASQETWPLAELQETARWIAKWSKKHNIPIRRGRVALGRVVRRGIVTHAQLGSIGGGHTDPGSDYPVKRVLELAKRIRKQLA